MSAHGASRSLGMSGAFICLPGLGGVFGNPANLAQIQGLEGEILVQDRFRLKELRELAIGLATPMLGGYGGLSIRQTGFEAYREQLFQAAFARNLGQGFDLGIRVDAGVLSIAEYGSRLMINAGAGLSAALSPQLYSGVFINHPFRQNALVEEFMPPVLGLGIRYAPAPQFMLLADAVKYLEQPLSLHAGIDYQINKALSLRSGASLAPARFSLGLGINLTSRAQMHLASAYHPYLGLSPALGLQYRKITQEN